MPDLEYSRRGPNGGFAMEANIDGDLVVLDPRLVDVLERAAQEFPLRVIAFSGVAARGTGTQNHPSGNAIDVLIFDENCIPIPNYNYAPAVPVYEEYAQIARRIQQQLYPELDDLFRWGGYFVSGEADLMHFDITGEGMAGGNWDEGVYDWRLGQIEGMTDGHVRYTDGRGGTQVIPASEVSYVGTRDYFGLPMEFYQRFGDNPFLVAQAQRYLRDNGYYGGAIDGTFGPATNSAMAQFAAEFGTPLPTPNPLRPEPTPLPLPQPNPLRPNPFGQPSAGFTPGTPGFAQSPAMQYAMLSGVGSPPVRNAGLVPRPGSSFGSAATTPAAPAWTALASGAPGVGQAASPGWAELAARASAAATGQNTAAGFGSPGYGQAAGAGWPSIAAGQSAAGLGTPGFGQPATLAAYQTKAGLGTPGFADYASVGAAGAKPYGLLDAEAMEADEQNAAKKAALTATRARTAGGGTAGKSFAAAPAADPNAPKDSDPVDLWMAKRRAEIAQRMLPPEPDSMELSDDLPIEEWMRRRNAQVATRGRGRNSAYSSTASSSGSRNGSRSTSTSGRRARSTASPSSGSASSSSKPSGTSSSGKPSGSASSASGKSSASSSKTSSSSAKKYVK